MLRNNNRGCFKLNNIAKADNQNYARVKQEIPNSQKKCYTALTLVD